MFDDADANDDDDGVNDDWGSVVVFVVSDRTRVNVASDFSGSRKLCERVFVYVCLAVRDILINARLMVASSSSSAEWCVCMFVCVCAGRSRHIIRSSIIFGVNVCGAVRSLDCAARCVNATIYKQRDVCDV